MRILVGYNGSDPSLAALYDLRHAGLPDDTEVMLMTVAETWPSPENEEKAKETASHGAAIIESHYPNWSVSSRTATGSPAREILAYAEEYDPHLIVVGEPRHGLSERNIFIGTTSHTLLTEAQCSVRIARGRSEEAPHPDKIIVGFDGSAASARAVKCIGKRSWSTGTCVRLLSVADSTVLYSIGRFTPQMADVSVQTKFASQWAQSLAASSKEGLSKAGICSSIELKLGHAKDVIIEEAEEWDADTIFMGPHSSGNSFERFLIGSVSAAVAARAHCSVEVVR